MRYAAFIAVFFAAFSNQTFADNFFDDAELAEFHKRSLIEPCSTSRCEFIASDGKSKYSMVALRTGDARKAYLVTNSGLCGSAGCESVVLLRQNDQMVRLKEARSLSVGDALKIVQQAAEPATPSGTTPRQVAAPTNAPSANCQIVNDATDRGTEIRWFGECKDGHAHGTGTTRWYKDGILNYEQDYSRTNGLVRSQGKPEIVVDIIDKKITLTPGSCDRIAGYRSVRVEADPSLALYNTLIVRYIINNRSQRLAWQHCPTGSYSNVDINVYVHGNRIIHARSYPPVEGPTNINNTNWAEFDNQTWRQRIAKYDQDYQREAFARQQEKQQRAQQQARQHAELQKQSIAQAKQAVRSNFVSKFGAQQLVNEQTLTTNPFVYKDKVIGVHTAFGRMIAADEALFYHDGVGMRAIVVSGVPATRFTSATPVVLAMKVRGTKAIKTAGGEAVLPHGEYVGIFECRQSSCSEFYD